MSRENFTEGDRKRYREAYEHIFLNQYWGNKNNSGTSYVRPYSKTKKKKEALVELGK